MKLIIKADDFGSTPGVTDGIAKGIVDGIVRDTSLLANSKTLDYAVKKAEEIGLLACGLHLTLTYGSPVLPASDLPSITTEEGKFYRNPSSIPKDYDVNEIEKEFRAQLAKFKETGLELTHLDSHHHVHALLNDEVVEVVMKIASEEGVPVRRQNDTHIPMMEKYGVRTTDYLDRRFGGNEEQSTLDHLIMILDEYKDKDCTLEVMTHPGFVDDELIEISSFTSPRETEVETLTSKAIQDYIKENAIELISFKAIKDQK
ncbi:carbohydrate deacetylase [Erysipelothrix urinaevulpis]|uniref:carbohydrate deacetylase n=1 Tax=Erysipelothrix urinaevulpis TaxID=2683717 RepID=UPI00135A3BB9|nr:carbohydrate deacetylase [Erysipelothrix urinaevulpis]